MIRRMTGHPQPSRERVDGDGVRIVHTSGVRGPVWLLALAMGLVTLMLVLILHPGTDREPQTPTRASAPQPIVNRVEPIRAAPPPAKPLHLPSLADERAVAPPPAPRAPQAAASAQDAEPPSRDDPVFGKEPPQEGAGIALFPPPGTKPIKRGILVPEDFELPPGYVRHYQATDDGQRVPAILMFHPDYNPVDEHGKPIPLPEDRVVPPEMAPPGMPVQMLKVPDGAGSAAERTEDPATEESER